MAIGNRSFHSVLFLLAPMLMGGDAMANETPVPLLSVPDIQASANPNVFQGVEGNSTGAIYFPDSILAIRVKAAEGDGQKIIDQWSKSHRFVLIPITISVAPKEGFIPEAVNITTAFSGLGQLKQQPIVIDIFPATGFNAGAFQGNASLKVDGTAKLAPLPAAVPVSPSLDAELSAGLTYKYTPAYANVVSGFASAHAFWQFARTQDKYPVGEISLKLLVAVPNTYTKPSLSLNFDVSARFSGSWWKDGMTVAAFTSSVALPERQK